MSRQEAVEQYHHALKLGEKHYKSSTVEGMSPYPLVLDEQIDDSRVAGRASVGLMEIPIELIVGTVSAGRTSALAGNYMPLLDENTEFAQKWIKLCTEQLDGGGIRDPIQCCEYLGRFYVQEGNKRVSVLKSLGAASIHAQVTRLVPEYADEPDIQNYYAFMRFFQLSREYRFQFARPEAYAVFQQSLGFHADHVWTPEERRAVLTAYVQFCKVYEKTASLRERSSADAFLNWLQVFPLQTIKELSTAELAKSLARIAGDAEDRPQGEQIEISTEPISREKNVLSRLISAARPEHLRVAFLYSYLPEQSAWTRAHVHGQKYLEAAMGDRISVREYYALDRDYDAAMQKAISDRAQVIFATTPQMIVACRRAAALHPEIRVLNCSLSLPYKELRTYYSRIYESKYIAGAVAGAMAEKDEIGYIASYPIVGVPAEINAFALGARLTNPRARIKLRWSCLDADPLTELIQSGLRVISNRDATNPQNSHRDLVWGTYKFSENGDFIPLVVPCWDWGPFYEKVVNSISSGAWNELGSRFSEKAINYWWGLDSGVIDIQMSPELPEGTQQMVKLLKRGIINGDVLPFSCRIRDQNGLLRCDSGQALSTEDLMRMDWLCENVDGEIPEYAMIRKDSRETVRILGLHRDQLPPDEEALLL